MRTGADIKSLQDELTDISFRHHKNIHFFVHKCSKDSVCSLLSESLDLAAHWSSEVSVFLETFSTKGGLFLCSLLWTNLPPAPATRVGLTIDRSSTPRFFICRVAHQQCLRVPPSQSRSLIKPQTIASPYNALRRNLQAFFTSYILAEDKSVLLHLDLHLNPFLSKCNCTTFRICDADVWADKWCKTHRALS